MSIEIIEKIESIRKFHHLSQNEFAEKVGISVNTYKGLISKNRSPSFEILEKIAAFFPDIAAYLLIDNLTDSVEQLSYEEMIATKFLHYRRYRAIQSLDPRLIEDICINPGLIHHFSFIQSCSDPLRMGAIIHFESEQKTKYKNDGFCVWLQDGRMSFSDERDENNTGSLMVVREWIKKKAPHLLIHDSIDIRVVEDKAIDRINDFGEIRFDNPHDEIDYESNDVNLDNFEKWKKGKIWI